MEKNQKKPRRSRAYQGVISLDKPKEKQLIFSTSNDAKPWKQNEFNEKE